MIVTLAADIQAQLGQYRQLQSANQAADNLTAALIALREVNLAANAFAERYTLLAGRLDAPDVDDLRRRADRAQAQLRELATEAASQQRQVRPLESARDSLRDLANELETRWRTQASARLEPQMQLLALLRQFRDLSAQAPDLAQLQRELQVVRDKMPRTSADLAVYDKVLRKVDDRVQALQAELPDVAFLQLVAAGSATLADVDQRTFAWCRQGDRGRMFRISFAPPGDTRRP